MIILRILEHDLHRSRKANAMPHELHTPAVPDFLPAVVSSTRGKFLVTRHLSNGDDRYVKPKDGPPVLRRGGQVVKENPSPPAHGFYLGSGVFHHDSDRVDDLLGDLFAAAHELSAGDSLGNVFSGKKAADRAFSHVQKNSGMKIQPHVCLVPKAWGPPEVASFFGEDYDADARRYRKHCSVVPSTVSLPVFLSRPDMVGMYTQFMGGGSSVFLHNVGLGMAFCELPKD